MPRYSKHNGCNRPEYVCWQQMNSRCFNPRNRCFPRYGGRGVTVCDRWRHDFAAFLADMGPRPSPKHSIDRIDNSGPYSPENCRWATLTEQNRNKRTNRLLTFHGETLPLSAWAERLGMPENTIRNRLRRGWSDERTLTEPVHFNPFKGPRSVREDAAFLPS